MNGLAHQVYFLSFIFIRFPSTGRVSSPIQKKVGNITKTAAEIQGTAKAVQIADRSGIRRLLIVTDSLMIYNIRENIAKWKSNNWKRILEWDGYAMVPTTDGEPIQNKEDILSLEQIFDDCRHMDIRFRHIESHSGDEYNALADTLAKKGAQEFAQIHNIRL